MEAIELFAAEVMGEFREGEAERAARKAEKLAPHVEAAFRRKRAMAPLADAQIAPVVALDRQIVEKPHTAGNHPAKISWRDALHIGEELQANAALRTETPAK
jgi:hypothetical protein